MNREDLKDFVDFAIRDKTTGLFSTGGMYPSWKVHGKIWEKAAHVRSHVWMLAKHQSPWNDNRQKANLQDMLEAWEVECFSSGPSIIIPLKTLWELTSANKI